MRTKEIIIQSEAIVIFKLNSLYGLFVDNNYGRNCFCSQCYNQETDNFKYQFNHHELKNSDIFVAESLNSLFAKIINEVSNADINSISNTQFLDDLLKEFMYEKSFKWIIEFFKLGGNTSDEIKLKIIDLFKVDYTHPLYFYVNW